ncbi:MAG: hypothetical protein ACOCRK_06340 [bacterium]
MVSCNECIYTKTVKGNECIHSRVTPQFMDKYNWDPHKLANNCKFFKKDYTESIDMTVECFYCGKEMDTNEEWFYIELVGDKIPVCSLRCKEKGQEKLDKELEEIDESNLENLDDLFE